MARKAKNKTQKRLSLITGEICGSSSSGTQQVPINLGTAPMVLVYSASSGQPRTYPQYPTHGKFPSGRPSLEHVMRREAALPLPALDSRQDRRAYVPERHQAMIPFALMEPNEGDAHNVFVDGMLMSPGSEDYKVRPPQGLLD